MALLTRRSWFVATLLLVTILGGFGLPMIEVPHSELISPDGRFKAVSERQWISSLLPSMPGQGSDSPGSITQEAWIPAVARWNLPTSAGL